MTFLVDRDTRVLIQGITGQLGSTVLSLMRSGGFEAVAGVAPGRGGRVVDGTPVFDTVAEACEETGANAALTLVPASGLLEAGLEAIDQRLDPIALMVDGVPINTGLELVRNAHAAGVTLIGPNSPGVISPGECLLGALDPRQFLAGDVAVISRSGGMMSTLAHTLRRAGIGQSTCLGIGGDSIIGLDMPAAARLAQADESTRAIVVFGEIGTTQEERLAAAISAGEITKPVVVYLAGASAPSGIRYSHAGAQIEGEDGSVGAKKRVLASAGVEVVDKYSDIPQFL